MLSDGSDLEKYRPRVVCKGVAAELELRTSGRRRGEAVCCAAGACGSQSRERERPSVIEQLLAVSKARQVSRYSDIRDKKSFDAAVAAE